MFEVGKQSINTPLGGSDGTEETQELIRSPHLRATCTPPQGTALDLEWHADIASDIALYRIRSNSGVRVVTDAAFNGYYLGCLDAGRIAIKRGKGMVAHGCGEVFVMDASRSLTMTLSGGGALSLWAISADSLRAALAALLRSTVNSRIHFQTFQRAPRSNIIQLLGAFELLLRKGTSGGFSPQQAPRTLQSLRNALVHFVLSELPHNYTQALRSRVSSSAPHSIERAIDFMRRSLGNSVTVSEIAGAAGISVRSLQATFRRYYSTTPQAFLRSLRLQAVRNELLDPKRGTRVARSARRWGFSNLGIFASHYRRAFGELPSATVQRTRLSTRRRGRRARVA